MIRLIGVTRTFLLLFKEIPIEKSSVKRGENSPLVVTAARSVNVALFLSNALRRDVSISLGIVDEKNLHLVTFPGTTIRRVSPDERSVTFFLLKAFTELDQIEMQESETLDNGIIVQKTTTLDHVSTWKDNVFLAHGKESAPPSRVENDALYIYEVDTVTGFQRMNLTTVPKPRTPERYILDINMIYDNIEWPMKKSS